MSNGFDKVAKKAEPGKSKKTTKIAATVTEDIRKAVDRVTNIKAQIRDLESELAVKEDLIITSVLPQQEAFAREGNFSKSFEVPGNAGNLTLTLADSFSVPQDDEALAEIKTTLAKRYDEFLEKKRFVSLQENVLKDEKITNKIITAITKAGMSIGEVFDVVDKVVTRPDVDRKQFELEPTALAKFRILVKQRKASLK